MSDEPTLLFGHLFPNRAGRYDKLEALLLDEKTKITPDLLRKIASQLGSKFFDSYLTPPDLISFIVKLTSDIKPKQILDPTCGSGLLLNELASSTEAKIIHGIEINQLTSQIATRLLGLTAKIFNTDCLSDPPELEVEYDLIVSEPPLGLRLQQPYLVPGVEKPYHGEFGDLLALWLSRKLSENGRGIIILPGSFIWAKRITDIHTAIVDSGVKISAAIQIPPGSFQGTSVEAYLFLFEKGKQVNDLFTGQYSTDKSHQKTLIDNLRHRRPGKHASQGRLCDWDGFKGFNVLQAEERLTKIAVRQQLGSVPMSKIVTDWVRTNKRNFEKIEEKPNSVFLPLSGEGKLSTTQDHLSSKLKDYLQLQLNPEKADAHFFAEFMNSEFGKLMLKRVRLGSTIKHIRIDDLLSLQVYLPDLEIQRKLVDTHNRIRALKGQVDEIESSLWSNIKDVHQVAEEVSAINREDRIEDWFDTLPFPLASILWRHHALSGSNEQKYGALLHFFEAVAEFMATIHLSAFSSDIDIWTKYNVKLDSKIASLNRASFGNWRLILEELGSITRKLLNNEPETCESLFGTQNHDVIRMLCNSDLFRILQTANEIRNTWHGHVGAISDRQAEIIHSDLFALVQELRGVFGRHWIQYELIQPGQNTIRNGIFHFKVKRLMGTRIPFEIVDRETTEGMEADKLFLLDLNGNQPLELIPFIKMLPSPHTEMNACFFYSRRTGDDCRYISYHFAAESDLTETFEDVILAFKKLSSKLSMED